MSQVPSVEGTLSLESEQTFSEEKSSCLPRAERRIGGSRDAEAEMDIRDSEQRNADIALCDTDRELESQDRVRRLKNWE